MITLDKYIGCFIGLAIGDAFGAQFEGGLIERIFWKTIGKTKHGKLRYTDDTQMSIDVANSFLLKEHISQGHLALTFAKSYRWSRGYGPSAAWLLRRIKKGSKWQDVNRVKFKNGSYGNGAAMRAPILAMCYPNDQNELKENVTKSSEITHAHTLAIEGAQLIAFATHAALHDWKNEAIFNELLTRCNNKKYQEKLAFCVESLKTDEYPDLKVLKNKLGNGIAALDSSVTAIYFALRYRKLNYNIMLSQIYKLGGDTDTIGAMSGSIWGAFNGVASFDVNSIHRIENSSNIIELANQLYTLSSNKQLNMDAAKNAAPVS